MNASPDLRAQFGGFPELHPDADTRRVRIAGVMITNADLDHSLGLLLLREGRILDVFATTAVRETLTRWFPVDALLRSFCGVRWHGLAHQFSPLIAPDGADHGLEYRAIALPGHRPRFAPPDRSNLGHSVALRFRSRSSGHSVVIAPGVAEISEELTEAMHESQAVLFDGTFWSSEELQTIQPGSDRAEEMGHMPVEKSLPVISSLRASHRIYVHINNTNPILQPDSPERKRVEAAGVTVGVDGMEITL